MPMLRVTCVTKDASNADRLIAGIGGDDFYHDVDEAVGYLDSRAHQYWTEVEGESVWLEVAHHPNGVAYLKTDNESFPPNRLLGLEECQSPDKISWESYESAIGLLGRREGNGQAPVAKNAEWLAHRTVVRLLVLSNYGRDEGRLARNRDEATKIAFDAVEKAEIDEDEKQQLQEALTREFDFLFAPRPQD